VKLRFGLWIGTVVFLIAGTITWLFLIRGERIIAHDSILMGGWIALSMILALVAILLKTTPADAIKLSQRTSTIIILATTCTFHACAIAFLWPALSDDLVRYRFDGRTWLARKSPYVLSPSEIETLSPQERGFAFDQIDLMVSFPVLHTIYPPTSELTFTAEAWIERALRWTPPLAPEWRGDPHPQWRSELSGLTFSQRALLWRLVDAALAVACVFAILALLRQTNQSPWWAILFAWNPLVLIETSGMAHQDIAGILLMLLMLLAVNKRRFALSGVLLALVIGVKPIAFLLAPFLLRDAAVRWRSLVATIAAFLVTVCILALPLLYQDGLAGMLLTGRIYSQNWEANGSVYEIFKILFGSGDLGRAMVRAKEMSRLLSVSMVLLTGLGLWQSRANLAEVGYWFFLILLICAPVVYPWYLLWILCFVPLLRGPQGFTGLVWSGTVALCYVLWRTSDWRMPPDALRWEYYPVAAMLGIEFLGICTRAPLARVRCAVS
jgi:Glycosyltransferase family 87